MSIFLSSPSAVMFCGSRDLPASAQAMVSPLVDAAVSTGAELVTGCASGADQLTVSAALADGHINDLHVFAIGSAAGQGFTARASAYASVYQAGRRGAAVTWWAGGGSSVPLRARLARRSMSVVSYTASMTASSSSSSSVCIGLVSSLPRRPLGAGIWPSCGSGSWSSLAMAARSGLSAVVVPVGLLADVCVTDLPSLSASGYWSAHSPVEQVKGFIWQESGLF